MKRYREVKAEIGLGTMDAFLKELSICESYHGVRALMWKHFFVEEDYRFQFVVCDHTTGQKIYLKQENPKNKVQRWECSMISGKKSILLWYQEKESGKFPKPPVVLI